MQSEEKYQVWHAKHSGAWHTRALKTREAKEKTSLLAVSFSHPLIDRKHGTTHRDGLTILILVIFVWDPHC